MSVTVNDALLGAYYRRGEASIPSDSNVQNRGISFVGEAYRELIRKNRYWFATKTYATGTVDGKDIYSLPTDYREMIEVRYNDNLVYPQSETTSANVYRYPPVYSPYPLNEFSTIWYYISGDELIIVPKATLTPTTYTISTTTISSTTATVTTTADHGFKTDDYVQIAGCTQDELNGSKRITVTSSTVFTYTVASGTTGESTGTATRNNFTFKYYYWATTSFTALTDTITIPDQYKDALSAYVFGRLAQMEGERGDAQDGFTEFNDIVKQMNKENMNRQLVKSSSSGVGY